MPLESSVTHIADLNPAWPSAADPKSDGDDHIRNQKKALLNDFAGYPGAILCTGTDGGAANAYTITPATSQPLPAYGLRMGVVFSPTVANTGACTLNISALGAKSLRAVDGSALVAGDLVVGVVYAAYYNGTEFRLTGPTQKYIDLVRDYATQLSFAGVLPAQAGSAGKFITTDGTNALWDWSQKVVRSVRTTAPTLSQTDRGALIDITSGGFTAAFVAAATLGSGWYCWMRNASTGDVTLDPNGAELIDGLTSYVMYPGEARLIQCDGAGFTSMVIRPFSKTFIASGTFIKPPGYSYFGGELWGGGGSGAKSSTNAYVAGGGGGGCSKFEIPASAVGTTETITIGSGGAAITTDNTNGNNGGDSTFGALLTAGGGQGGNFNTTSTNVVGYGGYAFFNNSNQAISNGTPGVLTAVVGYLSGGAGTGTVGGNSVYGGGSGGSVSNSVASFLGGSSAFAGRGGASSSSTVGGTAFSPAGGGGATITGTSSGSGARGEFRIRGIV